MKEIFKKLFKHECKFYESEVRNPDIDPKCYKCGKTLRQAVKESIEKRQSIKS
jgi:hypothetical protein